MANLCYHSLKQLVVHSMEDSPPLTPESVRDAIIDAKGNVSAAARHLGKSRTYLKAYIDAKPELLAILTDMREAIVDAAEDNIFDAVLNKDQGASRFVAQTLGKDRGWVPREEKTGKDGEPLIPPSITFAPYADEPEDNAPGSE